MSTQERNNSDYSPVIFNQYSLFVEMADRISERRGKTNQFYIVVLTGLITIISFTLSCSSNPDYRLPITGICSAFGLLLCAVWWVNLQSYGKLNKAKFKVIHKLEEFLPFACYKDEWNYLGNGADRKKYVQLSKIEGLVPIILCFPFLVAIIIVIFGY